MGIFQLVLNFCSICFQSCRVVQQIKYSSWYSARMALQIKGANLHMVVHPTSQLHCNELYISPVARFLSVNAIRSKPAGGILTNSGNLGYQSVLSRPGSCSNILHIFFGRAIDWADKIPHVNSSIRSAGPSYRNSRKSKERFRN